MIDHSALIQALFSTPWTEVQSCLPVKGFGGMDSLQSHDLRQFGRRLLPEKMYVFRGTFHHVVSSLEVLFPSPYLLDLMDFRTHEASGGCHHLEGVGEVMGSLIVIVRVVHFEICSCSSLDEVGVFSEGFPMAPLRSLVMDLPSSHLKWGCSLGVMSNLITSSFSDLGIITSWLDEWCHHLVLVGLLVSLTL